MKEKISSKDRQHIREVYATFCGRSERLHRHITRSVKEQITVFSKLTAVERGDDKGKINSTWKIENAYGRFAPLSAVAHENYTSLLHVPQKSMQLCLLNWLW